MRFLLTLVACLLVAFALAFILTIPVNPEVKFWTDVVERRDREIAQVRAAQPTTPIIFFTGGSSTAFSIHPSIIEEYCNTPAFNLGLPVASGAQYILHQALRHAQSGDMIVVALEPDLLAYEGQESGPTKIAFAIEAMRGNFTESAGGSTFDQKPTISDYLTLTRPGPQYLVVLTGRIVTGYGYRYKTADIGYRGIIRTDAHDPAIQASGITNRTALHPKGRFLLETFATAAAQKGVRLAYAMPWHFTLSTAISHNRANNRKLLVEIAEIMPILEDGFSGAVDGIENFSDSAQHLSDSGTAARSHALARSLTSYLHP